MNNLTQMKVSTDTDIDELIAKLEVFKGNLKAVNELIEKEEYLTAYDVAEKLGISLPEARQYMARPDFPKIEIGKGYKVSSTAFFLYNLSRREKNNA